MLESVALAFVAFAASIALERAPRPSRRGPTQSPSRRPLGLVCASLLTAMATAILGRHWNLMDATFVVAAAAMASGTLHALITPYIGTRRWLLVVAAIATAGGLAAFVTTGAST